MCDNPVVTESPLTFEEREGLRVGSMASALARLMKVYGDPPVPETEYTTFRDLKVGDVFQTEHSDRERLMRLESDPPLFIDGTFVHLEGRMKGVVEGMKRDRMVRRIPSIDFKS